MDQSMYNPTTQPQQWAMLLDKLERIARALEQSPASPGRAAQIETRRDFPQGKEDESVESAKDPLQEILDLQQQLARAQHKVAQVVAVGQELAELRVQVRTFIPQLLQENTQMRALLKRASHDLEREVYSEQRQGFVEEVRTFLARKEEKDGE
jgi:hypothetical protein